MLNRTSVDLPRSVDSALVHSVGATWRNPMQLTIRIKTAANLSLARSHIDTVAKSLVQQVIATGASTELQLGTEVGFTSEVLAQSKTSEGLSTDALWRRISRVFRTAISRSQSDDSLGARSLGGRGVDCPKVQVVDVSEAGYIHDKGNAQSAT